MQRRERRKSTCYTLFAHALNRHSDADSDANNEKQVVGDKVGFSAVNNGEQFWES